MCFCSRVSSISFVYFVGCDSFFTIYYMLSFFFFFFFSPPRPLKWAMMIEMPPCPSSVAQKSEKNHFTRLIFGVGFSYLCFLFFTFFCFVFFTFLFFIFFFFSKLPSSPFELSILFSALSSDPPRSWNQFQKNSFPFPFFSQFQVDNSPRWRDNCLVSSSLLFFVFTFIFFLFSARCSTDKLRLSSRASVLDNTPCWRFLPCRAYLLIIFLSFPWYAPFRHLVPLRRFVL